MMHSAMYSWLVALLLRRWPQQRSRLRCTRSYMPASWSVEAYGVVQSTMILYVPPHGAAAHLADMSSILGASRRCCVARELTKMYESFVRGSLGEVAASAEAQQLRGELTVVVAGSTKEELQAVHARQVRACPELDFQHSGNKLHMVPGAQACDVFA